MSMQIRSGWPVRRPTSRGADHAAHRTRVQRQNGPVGRGVGDHGAAVRLGHVQWNRQALVAESLGEPGEVVTDPGRDVHRGDGGGRALVLAPLRRHFVAQHDGDVGKRLTEDLPHLELVQGVHVGMDQGNGHRFVLGLGDRLGHHLDRVAVQRLQLLARGTDPLVDLKDGVPLATVGSASGRRGRTCRAGGRAR